MENEEKKPIVNNFSVIPPEEMVAETGPKQNIFLRIVILGVILAILIVLSVGIVKLLPAAFSSFANVNFSFSSLFAPKEKITVTSNKKEILSGESFIVSFKHTGQKSDGFYKLSTVCESNFKLQYQVANKNPRQIDCNDTVRLSASSTSFNLIGLNNNAGKPVTIPVSVDFISSVDGRIEVGGEAEIVINPALSTPSDDGIVITPAATSTDKNPVYSNPPKTNGTPDLVVRFVAMGVRDRNSGAFISKNDFDTNDRVTFQFQVTNIGGAPSGPWSMRAILPAANPADQTKYLYNQASIPAGLAVNGELYFDYVQVGQNRLVQINIDPSDQLRELRKDNNTIQATINVSNSGATENGVDLDVKILEVGILQSNGQFVRTSNIDSNDRVGVRVQVTNKGDESSGNWVLRVTIPDSDDDFDNDISQQSLFGGETRIFTIALEDLDDRNDNTIEITADPNDRIDETRENNNDDSVDIDVD